MTSCMSRTRVAHASSSLYEGTCSGRTHCAGNECRRPSMCAPRAESPVTVNLESWWVGFCSSPATVKEHTCCAPSRVRLFTSSRISALPAVYTTS